MNTQLIKQLVRLARPIDWVKNVFILLPVPFSVAAADEPSGFVPLTLAFGFLGFGLISSCIYVLNDIRDAPADRLHPTKKKRPIAAGDISTPVAISFGIVLLIGGLGFVIASSPPIAVVLPLTYIAINVTYSLGAKNVPLLDVSLIASGFVIRVLFGCQLVGATPSDWLLLCSGTISLFLAFAKRRADVAAGLDWHHRRSLAGYNITFLDQAMTIAATLSLLSYALYSRESDVFIEGRRFAGTPFVAYAVFNYLRLSQNDGSGDSPLNVLKQSRSIQICCVGWIFATWWSLVK